MPPGVIDTTVFRDLRDSLGADFIGELLQTFYGDSPGLLEQMRRALLERDSATLRRAAHTLKSNAATFGASRLAELARELETRARAEQLDEAGERIEGLAREFEKAGAALKEMHRGG